MMDKLKMHTENKIDKNVEAIGRLFPNTLTEIIKGYDPKGNPIIEHVIDFDLLKQELSDIVVEGNEERYQMNWPDKKKSILLANTPIDKTLRPCREESVNFDNTKNLYVEGDNLDVLKLLQETYLNRIKMIYIDPPYNTGNDSFVYNDEFGMNQDDFNDASGKYDEDGNIMFDIRQNNESNGRYHTDWLNMLYPRLKLAKDLLTDDGVIFISIDDNEVDNLKKICNEVFGENNFRNIIAVRRYDKNINRQFMEQGLSTMNVGLEYVLMYSKTSFSKFCPVFKESSKDRSTFGYWKGFWNDADRPTMRYEILGVKPDSGQWKWKQDVAFEAVKNYIEYEKNFKNNMTLEEYWEKTGKNKKFIRRNINGRGRNLGVEHWVAPADGILRNSNWSDLLASKPTGVNIPFDNPKNIDLIILLCKLAGTDFEDIILDFFSGSGTTAHAVMQLNAEDGGNRRFIMVQLPEEINGKSEAYNMGYKNICEIGKERIRRAGKKIKEEHPDKADSLDIGFRVLKLDSSNMKDVFYKPKEYSQTSLNGFEENIKEERTPEDLLFQVMLELGELISSDIEEKIIAGKKVYVVGGTNIIACFDNNITDEVVIEIAKLKPFYAVFRDSSMANDSVATNFDQIFETYSPTTVRKVL